MPRSWAVTVIRVLLIICWLLLVLRMKVTIGVGEIIAAGMLAVGTLSVFWRD
jgi:hypothetical protein